MSQDVVAVCVADTTSGGGGAWWSSLVVTASGCYREPVAVAVGGGGRKSWTIEHSEPPEGWVVVAVCGSEWCCRPEHLVVRPVEVGGGS